MTRTTLCALLFVVGCSSEDKPPDPLGACGAGQKAYGRIEAAVTMLAGYAPDIPVDSFCKKLRVATKSLDAATDDSSVVGGVVTKLDSVAAECLTKGVVRTQQALEDKLAEGREALAKTCSK